MLLFILLFGIVSSGHAQDNIKTQKTLADAIAVKNMLDVLTLNGDNPAIKPYVEKIGQDFEKLSQLQTGFLHYSLPITLMLDDKNKDAVLEIEKDIIATLNEVRTMVDLAKNQFEIDKYPVVQTLLSNHPGDYYTAINPSYSYNLSNHPLRSKIEEICLQDYSFKEMASGDTTLWNMGIHCSQLKRVYLFGCELTAADVEKINFNAIDDLTMLDLSENQITKLSADFNANNSLVYLSLRRNRLVNLGSSYHAWTNLRYLNLKGNDIPNTIIQEIQKALPKLKLVY